MCYKRRHGEKEGLVGFQKQSLIPNNSLNMLRDALALVILAMMSLYVCECLATIMNAHILTKI